MSFLKARAAILRKSFLVTPHLVLPNFLLPLTFDASRNTNLRTFAVPDLS